MPVILLCYSCITVNGVLNIWCNFEGFDKYQVKKLLFLLKKCWPQYAIRISINIIV